MKIIDLLNKIAKGEEVPKFKIKGHNAIWEYVKEFEQFQWETINLDVLHCLNDEVEIIEEKPKFETIGRWNEDIIKGLRNDEETSNWQIKNYISVLMATQNQIIDIVNYLLDKEEE